MARTKVVWRVTAPQRGIIVAEATEAGTFWRRLRGLILRPPLGSGQGLLIFPCQGVHGFFMAYDLEVLLLSREGRVLRAFPLPKNRPGPMVAGAYYALELPVGTLAGTGLQEGDTLRLERLAGSNT